MGARSAQDLIRELESIFESSALDDEPVKNEPEQIHAQEPHTSAAVEACNAGLALQKAGDKAKALEFYLKALAQDPQMIPELVNASIIYLEFKDFKNARSTLQKWAEADPQAAKPLAMLAQLECDSENYETAVKQLQKAIAAYR
jgi:tetratricopeptide (TPR) repeat protein